MTPQEETLIVAVIIALIQAYVAWLNIRARSEIVALRQQVSDLKVEIISLREQLLEAKHEIGVSKP